MTNVRQEKLLTIEQMYTSTPEGDQFERELEQSLHPRSKDMLLDMVTGQAYLRSLRSSM